MGHERIQLTDTPMSMLVKLAEGNPGGLTVMMQIIKDGPSIDPDAAFGPLAHILGLDTFGIYGSRIWMFYKDACKEDLTAMIAVMRAVQLGKLSESAMHHAIDNYGDGIDVSALLDMVQKELPNFGKKTAPQNNVEGAGEQQATQAIRQPEEPASACA